MDWKNVPPLSVLVGPGDVGKSTIIDALEFVLSPRWNLTIDDSDFWQSDASAPFLIRVTLTDLPKQFLRDDKYGLALHEFEPTSGEAVECTGGDDFEAALVVELRVEQDLEPVWNVVDANGNRRPIATKDRQALGMVRVGPYLDRHLGWSRGSLLASLTASDSNVATELAAATRAARTNLNTGGLTSLHDAAARVQTVAGDLGVSVPDTMSPGLDSAALSIRSGALSLHAGVVPVRRFGLGTRRLVAVAMQREAAEAKGLTLIDEVEHGLEPHRLRRVLRVLGGKPPETSGVGAGHAVLSTHSPTTLTEVEADAILVVRRDQDSNVTVQQLPAEISYLVKRVPDALLAYGVVIGEGLTEVGLISALDEAWESELEVSFAYRGYAIVDGGGGNQPTTIAGHLDALGYDAAVLFDSDAKSEPSKARGAQKLQWPGGVATEEIVALDLPIDALREMTCKAVELSGTPRKVRDSLIAAVGASSEFGGDPKTWLDGVDHSVFRKALGTRAKTKGWFKSYAGGKELGKLVHVHWDEMKGTRTRTVLDRLKSFVHGA